LDPATNSVARGAMFYTNLNHTGKTAADAMVHDPIANGVMAKYTSFINI
jgi:type 1 glutamine amidotransferase